MQAHTQQHTQHTHTNMHSYTDTHTHMHTHTHTHTHTNMHSYTCTHTCKLSRVLILYLFWQITQLKIENNPYARAFRESIPSDGHTPERKGGHCKRNGAPQKHQTPTQPSEKPLTPIGITLESTPDPNPGYSLATSGDLGRVKDMHNLVFQALMSTLCPLPGKI